MITHVEELRTLVPWTDVVLPRKRTDRHRVLVDRGQVVRERAIHVPHAVKSRWHQAAEHGNEAGAQQSLEQILAAVEVRHDHVLAVIDPSE